jgi:hypothetical protein
MGQRDNRDPTATWAIVLVDLAHHVALSLEGALCDANGRGVSRTEILTAMRAVLDAEWRDRTDEVQRLTDA